MERDFKGIWIPKEIWLAKDLTLQEKVFLVEIDSLDNEDGCFATNSYFAEFFELSKTRVSLVVKSLIDKKYIESTIVYKEGTKEILKRVLKVCYRPYLIKVKDPIQQKLKDNNTVNNTINNTINNICTDLMTKPHKVTNNIKYAEFVSMTEDEYKKLTTQYGEAYIKEKIIDLNLWKGSKGKSTKSDYMTLLTWIRKDSKSIKPKEIERPNAGAYRKLS
jgi:hypothetical protein